MDGSTSCIRTSRRTRRIGKKATIMLSFPKRFILPVVILLLLPCLARSAVDSVAVEQQLREAAKVGDIALVRNLLDKGANVNAKDRNGWTPLMRAAWPGQTEVARLLLEKGADINAKDHFGWTAFAWSAWGGHWALVRLLAEKGTDVNVPGPDRRTALILASSRGELDMVKLLLDKGADVQAKDENGITALIAAARMGRTRVVELLLKHGADPNAHATFPAPRCHRKKTSMGIPIRPSCKSRGWGGSRWQNCSWTVARI